MHLLAAQPGGVDDGSEAVDLGQTPGDVIVLSAADTELATLAAAQGGRLTEDARAPSLRLANILHLGHNMSVDLYADTIISKSKLVVVRVLGGRSYWSYGVDQLAELCGRLSIPAAFLPGDDQPDAELSGFSTLPADTVHRLWRYLVEGGAENAAEFLKFAAALIGHDAGWREPKPLPAAGLYWPGGRARNAGDLSGHWAPRQPVCAVTFYRALVQAGNTGVVDGLIKELRRAGLNPLPVYLRSLKDPVSIGVWRSLAGEARPAVILNGTGFAVSKPGGRFSGTPLDGAGVPVLQMVFSGGNREGWETAARGLSARDIAMNVALPEVDGRVLSRAVSFKGRAARDINTQCDVVSYEPVPDRLRFVANLAANWARLASLPNGHKRVAIVLANYPNKDSRLGNGVGLDTPAGVVRTLGALKAEGYEIGAPPETGDSLIRHIQAGPTNDHRRRVDREVRETLSLAAYQTAFEALPESVREHVAGRWGAPETDPFFSSNLDAFALPAFRTGNIVIGLQPARGYNIDPKETYHSPDLVPPHGYLAFYIWLRERFMADAVLHFGKHGNMEWLPGKALALSETCFPEAVFGPLPHIYPFIVNDPGEGTQAKRRAQAVIIDHLTPPLTRAESYGPLKDLEALVDEYYEAAGVDPRRLKVLKENILGLCRVHGLDADIGIAGDDGEDDALAKLDNYLCELKETQIRDGLHIFGAAPEGDQLTDLLVALVRAPRGTGPGDQSLLRALCADLNIPFDPLAGGLGDADDGPRPEALKGLADAPWRTKGDTVERLEALSRALVSGAASPAGDWTAARAVLQTAETTLRPLVEGAGASELEGLKTALAGRFVEPGPSGAPTRGRPDVLPTGRNFYSVDTRTVPTPAAWRLGWASANLLCERHAQDHGDWPRSVALSAWGTSNMRTGGDDIAQALALMGVKPAWDAASRRVTGFEVLPVSVLGRPRVDVTLRISGFFRDAFPALIDLMASAAAAVAKLDEPETDNPLAAAVRAEVAEGGAAETASLRVFGSKPGAYGAGLQALIDEKGWETDADLAAAYLAWGGHAYGSGLEGEARRAAFEKRLGAVQAVIHNQDNREHDLLDSDDYYQFEGGMTAAVRTISGNQPAVYHNDHSRPETPRVRTLEDEIARTVRARVTNPKWIKGVMRHGYKGAFEMAATVDYLFAFAATARCVRDHHFDAVFQAYLDDEDVLAFLNEHNPEARRDMAERLREAQERGLWVSRLNSVSERLTALSAGR